MSDSVNHPPHYKADNGIEAIDVVEGFGLNFRLGNAATYILRADRKGEALKDLKKARWYIDREIATREPQPAISTTTLYYLATPYTNYPSGMPLAFEHAADLAGRLMLAGYKFFCPISHGHPFSVHGGVSAADHALWLPFDEALMERCDALLVALMAGWRTSKGVAHEIEFFKRAGKPILYVCPDELTISTKPHATFEIVEAGGCAPAILASKQGRSA